MPGWAGKAAVEIGRRLARLARLAQVIVVTHLPQVAAFADAHLVVQKADDGSVTRSGVTRLDDAGRVPSCPGCWPAWRTPRSAGRTPVSCSPPRPRNGPRPREHEEADRQPQAAPAVPVVWQDGLR